MHGYNALENNGDPSDSGRHGTHVAGTIAAEGNNGQGVVGVNWRAQIMPIKIFDEEDKTSVDTILRGLIYATDQGARITSNSWGRGGEKNLALEEAFRHSPALHVAAAGNDRSDNDQEPHYPSSYDIPNLIAVAATDNRDRLAGFSNYGEESVDLAAPGASIYSTVPGGYFTLSGTSMATPHVSGAAALVLCEYPELTNEEVIERLVDRSDRLDSLTGKVASGGRLNLYNALEDDTVAPAASPRFGATDVTLDSFRLEWVATGDDGLSGLAARYDLRNLETGERLKTPVPSPSGSLESVEVQLRPWVEPRQFQFGLRTVDNAANSSPQVITTVELEAAPTAFYDDFDGADPGWQAEGCWGRVALEGRGFVYADSPSGDYPPDQDSSLTSPPISLEGLAGSTLLFDTRYNLQRLYDSVYLEVTSDGEEWTRVGYYSNVREDWSQEMIDLSDYDGQTIKLRFRLRTDRKEQRDGFYLDRLALVGQDTVL